jgi:hypothetical protein
VGVDRLPSAEPSAPQTVITKPEMQSAEKLDDDPPN